MKLGRRIKEQLYNIYNCFISNANSDNILEDATDLSSSNVYGGKICYIYYKFIGDHEVI